MNTVQSARKRGVRAEVPITRDVIVTTAFRLIEERGLEQFSMRSLATELGVFPATLYWHVGDRSQLLGMVEFLWIEQVELPDHLTDWREWMAELARRYRRNAFAHPNVARLTSLERARNNESLVIPDAIIGTLAGMGLGDQMVHAYNTLMGAVRGFVVMELAPRAEPDAAVDVETDLRSLDAERFPHITEHFDEMADQALSMRWSDAAEHPLDESFEFLVKVLLDGLAAQLPRKRK
jgi:TetR/AcrR family transcriptional regulator, tetracycline repressor protein